MINGERLKLLRERFNLSAQELADHLGIGVAQVFRYEAEKTDPTTGTLIKIAKFFDVRTDYLLGLVDDSLPPVPGLERTFFINVRRGTSATELVKILRMLRIKIEYYENDDGKFQFMEVKDPRTLEELNGRNPFTEDNTNTLSDLDT